MSNVEQQGMDAENQSLVFPVDELIGAREARGLSRQEVAKELRLSEKYIEALENGNFGNLPSLVFARGYVASYTKLLQLDTERFLVHFDALHGRAKKPAPMVLTGNVGQQAKLGDPIVRGSAWLFVLAVIAVSIWWWKTQNGAGQIAEVISAAQRIEVESADGSTLVLMPIQTSIDAPAETLLDVPVNVNGLTEQSLDAEVQGVETVAVDEADRPLNTTAIVGEVGIQQPEPGADAAAMAQEMPVPNEAETLPVAVGDAVVEPSAEQPLNGAGRVRITFSDECWVSVKDAEGKVLAMRVKPAGSELDVSGVLPLAVRLGRADAVSGVYFNGEQVELASKTGVVKLTLPLGE